MGDENTPIQEEDLEAVLRHVLGRTGFGPAARDMKKATRKVGKAFPMTRGGVADYVLGLKRKVLKAKGDELFDIHNKWVKHLLKGKTPLLDKIVLFWHDHFSVSASVVDEPEAVTLHLENHYTYALGNFKDYVKAINKDPAMMIFLNTNKNNKDIPNENYARELCELFTLGVFDLNGLENYSQDDIVQIARAFTGWKINGDGEAYLKINKHDFMAEFPGRGPKVLFDNAYGFPPGGASFTTGGEGENEIDEVVDILFAHTDSDGENTVARRTAFRLLEYFAYASPDKSVVDDVVSASSFDTTWDIEALMRAIMVHDAFYETAAEAPFSAATKKSVKWPIDYVVGAMRMTKMKGKGRELILRGGDWMPLFDHLANMGQIIGEPPSVFGWDWEEGWVSSSTLLARYEFARDIANARSQGRFKPEKLIDKELRKDPAAAADIADSVINVLGLTGQLTAAERDEVIEYLTDNGVNPILDLSNDFVRNVKLHGVFALLMQSPAFQLH